MAKIIYKRKYNPVVSQTLSALIIIGAILISYLQIDMVYKIIGYAALFLLNMKLIVKIAEGDKLTSEQHKELEERRIQRAKARLTEEKYNEVKQFVINEQRASESLIERTFNLDYFVAKVIIERLVEEGVVGEVYDTKPRKVLVKKLGALVGDCSEIGCNTVLNPGTIVGKNTTIYPLTFVRGVIKENSIMKNNGEIVPKK